ncbi:hypothetical protein AB4Z34_36340 [Ensifer sp. 2YAB10]|uniref:hypothetical protein n=1 Tax=Ensifer sp. 2YAB10 TaxID=3233021 RepID=UPI003F8DFA06
MATSVTHAATKCTDRKTTLYTDGECPAGWLEIVGNMDIRKLPPDPVKEWPNQNAKVEREIREMANQSRRKDATGSQSNATRP